MAEPDPRQEPIRTATAMALAVHHDDLRQMFELWQTSEKEDRPAVLESLARLPSVMAQAVALYVPDYDPESALSDLVAMAAEWNVDDADGE